ncbi:rust resistance kinase Lr10-like isoform X5 [Quercus robur]|uniref:rust resistance kinase Lr10-like isoform X5 n=1 Tax=Quercus robur TaxID=38942 RepID=UPI002161AB97|nr:rust resistance kinase Lr10-like isoform X5 [Quercus robur]
MDISLRIVIPTLLLFVLFIVDLGEGHKWCPERCGDHGPDIRFPFRLIKDRQPDHHGGFDLYCNDKNDTVLELSTSVKAFVKKIDYKSQSIEVTDSDGCFPRKIWGLKLNLSSSSFQFKNDLSDYALFKCTPDTESSYYLIPCLSSFSTPVYAFPSERDIDDLSILSCTKMYSVSSVPFYIWRSHSLQLTWSGSECGRGEVKGKNCRFQENSTDVRTECKDKGSSLGSFLLILVIYALYRVYRYDKTEKENQARIEMFLEDYKALKPTRYSYSDVKRITNQFTEKLGQGAYGTVFKGKFSNEIHVAVKILNSSKGNGEEFINEVVTMGRIHHVNVVRLVGFCADGFRRALVYEFLPNDSLEKFISSVDSNRFLGWEKLQDIALGIAKGIEYLHQGCDQRILHFDIKPHNILLDQNFNPKISDFGLAKLCAKDQSAVSMTTARGTMGYIAPEVFSRNFGSVSYKSDIYSFGILLLEMVGGRKNVDVTMENTSQIYFPEWIYNLLEQKEDLRVYVEDNEHAKIAKKLAIVGLWCIQWHPVDRPSMKVVVQMLEGEGDKLTMPPNPFASTGPTRINVSMPARRLNQELEVILESE